MPKSILFIALLTISACRFTHKTHPAGTTRNQPVTQDPRITAALIFLNAWVKECNKMKTDQQTDVIT